jgi:quinolinate synthase
LTTIQITRASDVLPDEEVAALQPTIDEINRLKEERNAIVAAHNYMTPDIYHLAADITGDSLALAVVESLGVDRVIFTPDQYLGKWVATQTDVDVILWEGACMVHERFTGEEIAEYKRDMGGIPVIAHPESPPDVLAEADYVGSTHGMITWVTDRQPERVMMITECSMADNVAGATPNTTYVRPCNLCPHMKRITLGNIKTSLETMTHQVEIPEDIAERARRAVTRMLEVGRQD